MKEPDVYSEKPEVHDMGTSGFKPVSSLLYRMRVGVLRSIAETI